MVEVIDFATSLSGQVAIRNAWPIGVDASGRNDLVQRRFRACFTSELRCATALPRRSDTNFHFALRPSGNSCHLAHRGGYFSQVRNGARTGAGVLHGLAGAVPADRSGVLSAPPGYRNAQPAIANATGGRCRTPVDQGVEAGRSQVVRPPKGVSSAAVHTPKGTASAVVHTPKGTSSAVAHTEIVAASV